jgi:hypothetical protein
MTRLMANDPIITARHRPMVGCVLAALALLLGGCVTTKTPATADDQSNKSPSFLTSTWRLMDNK